MPEPYYADDAVTLYLGDSRELLPALDLAADLIVTDPPYGETSLSWDRWPTGWPSWLEGVAPAMWCFGSMRMFLAHCGDFAGWKLSQDVVWEKPIGTGFTTDRFRRVHEFALHWYRGNWKDVHHATPRTEHHGPRRNGVVKHGQPGHTGVIADGVWTDDGTRIRTSVLRAPNMHRRNIHPTQKPTSVLAPLIEYGCPPGGLVVDPFAGSGSTLEAARLTGRRAIGIEASEAYAERAARRLSQAALPLL